MASTSSNIGNSEIDRLLVDSDYSDDESEIDFSQDEFIDLDLGLDENNVNKHGVRRDTVFWCPDCEAGLCLGEFFKVYHTKSNF